MGELLPGTLGILYTIVNSVPVAIDFTAMERSTLVSVAEAGLMVKGMNMF